MCAIESATTLINGIHEMHSALKPGEHPTKAAISAMFQRYQEERMPRTKAAFDATALITRMHACDGAYHWFAMRCVFPATGMKPYADSLGDLCSGAPKSKFLPIGYKRPATIKWKDEPDHVPASEGMSSLPKLRDNFSMEFSSLLSLLFLVFFVFGSVVDQSLSTSRSWESSAGDILLNRLVQLQGPATFKGPGGSQPQSNYSPIVVLGSPEQGKPRVS